MWYAGLTDYPNQHRRELGNPREWRQVVFHSPDEARHWEQRMAAAPGYRLGRCDDGWHYGYVFQITQDEMN